MKNFLLAISLCLVITSQVKADACTESMGNVFTAFQEQRICAINGVFTTSNGFEAVAGAGTNQATAAPLSGTKFYHQLTGANGTLAWVMPTANAFTVGRIHYFFNTTAGVANIFPATGGTINGAAANAVFAALTGIKPIICIQTAATAWICS